MTDIHPKQLENVARAIASADYDTEYRPDYDREGFIESAWPSYKEQAEAAIRAAFKPLPIEDAPKDGTKIQLVNFSGDGGYVSDEGWWEEGERREEWDEIEDGVSIKLWEEQEEGSWVSSHGLYELEEPTHFYPNTNTGE